MKVVSTKISEDTHERFTQACMEQGVTPAECLRKLVDRFLTGPSTVTKVDLMRFEPLIRQFEAIRFAVLTQLEVTCPICGDENLVYQEIDKEGEVVDQIFRCQQCGYSISLLEDLMEYLK